MSADASPTDAPGVPGIHHVTAIASSAQRNLDFYTDVLGLRLVKRTVNFDDPGTYHLYYGDRLGTPGTIMTFFPWSHAAPGRRGSGFTDVTGFSVPTGSLEFWAARLAEAGARPGDVETLFGAEVLPFEDPDGLVGELVAEPTTKETAAGVARHRDVPAEYAIRSFHGVVLDVAAPDATAKVLTNLLGFEPLGEEGGRLRFRAGADEVGAVVDLLATGSGERGLMGAGSVHHVAFRARDDEEQQVWRDVIARAAIHVTTVQDRNYFRSIYFREPGGVLFEIATDAPGFTVDEPEEELGRHLKLPPQYEGSRAELESRLQPLTVSREEGQ